MTETPWPMKAELPPIIKTGAVTAIRYERKWVPPGFSLAEVLAMVRRHPAAFRPAFPERQVNNVYLDTPELNHYHDHISGASERMKVRLRWYGEFSTSGSEVVLELKRKRGWASWKESFPLPGIRLADALNRAHLPGGWNVSCLPDSLRLRLRSLRPAVANHYRRHYFQTPAGGIRLTVDSHLGFFGFEAPNHGLRRLNHTGLALVVELKYLADQADQAAEIVNRFPFRLCRCSKYVLGIQQLDGR
jgi:hypothetical protein